MPTDTADWEDIDLGDDVTVLDDEAEASSLETCCQPHRG